LRRRRNHQVSSTREAQVRQNLEEEKKPSGFFDKSGTGSPEP
jgi:hypothetical protein